VMLVLLAFSRASVSHTLSTSTAKKLVVVGAHQVFDDIEHGRKNHHVF
jgi:ABC-type transporter MlaC component